MSFINECKRNITHDDFKQILEKKWFYENN